MSWYEIPIGAYPRNWESPPDPPPEALVKLQVASTLEVEFEASLDPIDEDQVRAALDELLNDASEKLQQSNLCLRFQFSDNDIVGP